MSDPDQTLLKAAQEGDRRALERLLEKHETEVYRFGLRMCGNEQDAQDVLQETLLTAFRGVRDFRGDASLSTWLYQIARSFCSRSRRGAMDRAPTVPIGGKEAVSIPDPSPSPDGTAHAREIGEVLRAAIAALPEGQREVIVLRDLEGLSAEEAAAIVGIEVGALKSRLHRARMELRRLLTATLGEPETAPCPQLAQDLSAYAADDIDASACARIEEHLASCERCTGACESLKRTLHLCRTAPGGEVPGPVRAAVWGALRGIAS